MPIEIGSSEKAVQVALDCSYKMQPPDRMD